MKVNRGVRRWKRDADVSPMRLRPLLLCSSLAFAGGLASVVERAPTAAGIDRIGAVVDRIRTTQRFAAGVADRCAPLVDALDAVDGADDALTLANSLGVRDAPPPRQPRGPKKKKGPSSTAPRLPYNAFATESGVEIRVGRRASDNDLLSCDSRYRDGPDWWLHAAGCPGSHVVIRSHDDNLPSNDADAVRDAACLAALFSKAIAKPPPGREHEASGRASVSLTRARHVSKPPGAKPGLVALKGDVTTIRVDLGAEGKRLKRLMATKDAVK